MTTLYAFGCSNTYGQALPDCYVRYKDRTWGSGPQASVYSWPALVARRLGYDCCNLALPGAANKLILHRTLNTEYTEDSLVVIHWTHATRYTVLRALNLEKFFKQSKSEIMTSSEILNIGAWRLKNSRNSLDKSQKESIREYYEHIHDEQDQKHQLHQKIYCADLHLKRQGIRVLHAVVGHELRLPRYLMDAEILEWGIDKIAHRHPRALDGEHPGANAHKEFSEQVILALKNPRPRCC